LKRYFRSRARMIGSLGQPILFLLALGFGLGPTFARAGSGDYVQFLAPGIVTMGILFTAVFSGIEIIWDRQFGFLKETLVAPVSRFEIVLGRTLGSATVALIQGSIVFLVCLAAGFRPAHPLLLPVALLFMVLIVHGDRHRRRLGVAGHAGLSADHELHRVAALLLLKRAVSGAGPAGGGTAGRAA
jgi:ABC-2 type transport system permease protein